MGGAAKLQGEEVVTLASRSGDSGRILSARRRVFAAPEGAPPERPQRLPGVRCSAFREKGAGTRERRRHLAPAVFTLRQAGPVELIAEHPGGHSSLAAFAAPSIIQIAILNPTGQGLAAFYVPAVC